MDSELLMALLVLWCGSTMAMIIFLNMWFSNDGAAFHPHSVDVETRHPGFLVVNSKTVCKRDCAIKSVSAFVAPRGSSSSKHFTTLCMMISIAGMLGSSRWYFVGDATYFQAVLSFLGFGSLILVAAFELDVAPERFLEDKLMVTGWLIYKLKMDKLLPFPLTANSKEFRRFIRNSPLLYHLYEEDRYLYARKAENIEMWTYEIVWESLHMVGAISYVTLVPAAILLNDIAEEKVAWITGATFLTFCMMGYFTGNYVPVLPYFRAWIMTWNPFLREPHFMLKLKKSVEAYLEEKKKAELGELPRAEMISQIAVSPYILEPIEAATTTTPARRSARNRSNSGTAADKNKNKNQKKSNNKPYGAEKESRELEEGELESYTKVVTRRRSGRFTTATTNHQTTDKKITPSEVITNGHVHGYTNNHSTIHSNIHSTNHSSAQPERVSTPSTGHTTSDEEEVIHTMQHQLRAASDPLFVDEIEAAEADLCLDSTMLRYARYFPTDYLYVVSYVMVMSELISMMTPCVAMGIQWITALCDGPPVLAILELGWESFNCLWVGGIHCSFNPEQLQHCILRASKVWGLP